MELKIIDMLGVESGIQIGNVNSLIEQGNNRVIIRGIMSANNKMLLYGVEPEIMCDVLDNCGRIIMCKEGIHHGLISISGKATFEVDIREIDSEVSWDDISEIQLSVIFKDK